MTFSGVIAFLGFFHRIRLLSWSVLRHGGWRQTYNVRKNIVSQFQSPTVNWPIHSAARSLCDSWGTCATQSTLSYM